MSWHPFYGQGHRRSGEASGGLWSQVAFRTATLARQHTFEGVARDYLRKLSHHVRHNPVA